MRLHRGGGQKAPDIYYIHGFMGKGREFEPLHDAALGDRRAYFVDLPGHGCAPISKLQGVDLFRECCNFLAFNLPPEPVDIVAYSLGGRLALSFALSYPHRVRRLLLESTSPGLEDSKERLKRVLWDEKNRILLSTQGMKGFLSSWYNLALFDSLRSHTKVQTQRQERLQLCAEDLAIMIDGFSPGRMQNMWPLLSQLSMPVHFVSGALDGKYDRVGERLCSLVASAEHIQVPKAGHNVHFERPEAFVAIMRAFLGG